MEMHPHASIRRHSHRPRRGQKALSTPGEAHQPRLLLARLILVGLLSTTIMIGAGGCSETSVRRLC